MENSNNKIERYEEDEIYLRDLFKKIYNNKMKIGVITVCITLMSLLYIFMVPKVYEVKAIVKIGEYKLSNSNSNSNNSITLADASELSKELEILYITLLKNKKDREAWIEKISLIKDQKNLIEISSQGLSNELAKVEIEKVIEYIQNKHEKILLDVRERRESQISQAEGKFVLLKTKTLPALKGKIIRYNKNIELYEENFKNVQNNLKDIKKTNPTLATIQINEQKYLADILINLKDSLEKFESHKNSIEMVEISTLQQKINTLKTSIKPYNYHNTDLIGELLVNDYPIKPNKKLIVAVAFITGFIFSIFLVFFLEFLKVIKKEEVILDEKSS